jgi:hypothetical protein
MKTKEQIEMLAIKSSEKRSLENRDYRIGFEDGYKMAQEEVSKNLVQPDVIKSVCLHEWDEGSHNVHKCTKCGKYNC